MKEKNDDWIRVEDQLPKHLQDVKFKGRFPYDGVGFFEKTENGYSFYFKTSENKIYQTYGVTHWKSNERKD